MRSISKSLNKLLKTLENRLGLVILIIFVIIILYATWIFYNFVYKSISALPKASFETVEIKKTVFEKITERIELREQNISKAMGKEYPDIFK